MNLKLNHFTHKWLQFKKLNSQVFLDSPGSPKDFQHKIFPPTGIIPEIKNSYDN